MQVNYWISDTNGGVADLMLIDGEGEVIACLENAVKGVMPRDCDEHGYIDQNGNLHTCLHGFNKREHVPACRIDSAKVLKHLNTTAEDSTGARILKQLRDLYISLD